MNLKKLTDIKDRISQNKLKEAFQLLKLNFKGNEDLIVLENRFNKIEKDIIKGIVSYEESSRERVKIVYSLLELINNRNNEIKPVEEDSILSELKEMLLISGINENIKISYNNPSQSLMIHEKKINNWSKSFNFNELSEKKYILDVYVDLDYYVTPRRYQLENKPNKKINLDNLLKSTDENIIILGQPGAGKTTTIKKLIQSYISQKDKQEKKFFVTIRLRELNEEVDVRNNYPSFLLEKIFSIFGIKINIALTKDEKDDKQQKKNLKYDVEFLNGLIINFLDNLGIIIFLDGFDELSADLKQGAVSQIRELSLGLSNSIFILTSRTGDFNFSIENSKEFEICSLSDGQIKQFIKNWIRDEEKEKLLYSKIKKSPFADTAMRPLNLAHLCAIFEKYGDIPDQPKSIYKKVVTLLIEEWDAQRSIKRESNYSQFVPERKQEFLSHLSFNLSTVINKTIFKEEDILKAYHLIKDSFKLPKNEALKVIREIETHNGLFLKTGSSSFEFSHKSIQEYLTAEYIVRLPMLYQINFSNLPNELAIATSISSQPNMFLSNILFAFDRIDWSFAQVYIDRILLEKPDFKNEPMLGVAFLYLFSFSKNESDKNRENLLFRINQNEPVIRDSIKKASGYYRKTTPKKNKRLLQLTYNNSLKENYMLKIPHRFNVYEDVLKIIEKNTVANKA